jgi:hypothetical protein
MFYPTPQLAMVIKVTKPPNFGARGELTEYIKNLIWSNILFGDDIQLAGVLQTTEGISLVTTQPYIVGKSPMQEQITIWFEDQGYANLGHGRWKNRDGAEVADTHPGNFILMKSGLMVPIDLQVLKIGNTRIPAMYKVR